MHPITKPLLGAVAVLALAVCVVAQDKMADKAKKPAAMAPSKILQPQMTPTEGTYTAPAGSLGDSPLQPWSATTTDAAVDKKTNPGATIKTVTGEIVDFSCYLQIGKHGDKHRACAQKCFTAGQPIGLLAQDGTLYMLMEEEHDPRRDGQTNFRTAATEHAGHIMAVTGTAWSLNGYHALYVTGFIKK